MSPVFSKAGDFFRIPTDKPPKNVRYKAEEIFMGHLLFD